MRFEDQENETLLMEKHLKISNRHFHMTLDIIDARVPHLNGSQIERTNSKTEEKINQLIIQSFLCLFVFSGDSFFCCFCANKTLRNIVEDSFEPICYFISLLAQLGGLFQIFIYFHWIEKF